MRSVDGRRFVLKIIPVDDIVQAQALAAQQAARYDQVEGRHLVRRHGAIALADGTLALVLDEDTGGSLSQLLGARGQLTAGETVTTVAPLLRALADLHAAGVVHGDLAPASIRFSADGKPLIGSLGVARLLGRQAGPFEGTGAGGFVAPELVGGAVPSPASDVYAMAALGWFCLTGAAPAPAAARPSPALSRPDTPTRLVEALTACLASDPAVRPSAGEAAVTVFDAVPAESVALAPVSDPAAEITRRIRAAAVSVCAPAPPRTWVRLRTPLVVGVAALVVAALGGAGVTWFLQRPAVAVQPSVVRPSEVRPSEVRRPVVRPSVVRPSVVRPSVVRPGIGTPLLPTTTPTTATRSGQSATSTPRPAPARSPARVTSTPTPRRSDEVLTASGSPRTAAAGLLQALADARALAYVARNAALLDLVYAPGAASAETDRGNIATALRDGGTYLGLSYIIRDATFLDATPGAARIRATILTPAYATGQPDGRKIPHAQETLGPCIFSLSLTPDGWRILRLTVPG